MTSTYTAKPHEIKRDVYLIDATGISIGRLASNIASLLRGKHKAIFTPHVDTGDVVIVVNAKQVHATGSKEKTKMYYHHTGFPGGIKAIPLEIMREKYPERIIHKAVKNMLPRGPLGRKMAKKLWVYAGAEHPHQAQQPKEFLIGQAG